MDPELDMVSPRRGESAEPSNHDMTLDITFFVPCYNEERLIATTLETILKAVGRFPYSYEILVVDDGSVDQSRLVVKNFVEKTRATRRGEVLLVENTVNRGLGSNYFKAAKLAKGQHFMATFGDHSEPLEALVTLLNLLGKAEVIIPYFNTRLFSKKYCMDHRRFSRRLLSVLFNHVFVRLLSGHRLHYYNGPVLHRTENVLKYRVGASGFAFQCEMLCKLLNDRKSYLEVMVSNIDRLEGKTTAFRWKNIRSVAGSLLRIFINRFGHEKRIPSIEAADPG